MIQPRSVSIGVFLIVSLASTAHALDSTRRLSQYGHTSWRLQDGGLGGQPIAITQTTDGYIWIATESGLLRFDGVRFVRWTPPDGSTLPTSHITAVTASRDGGLWIGTAVGLRRWTGDRLVSYPTISGRINVLHEDRTGTLWAGRIPPIGVVGALCEVRVGLERCYAAADGASDNVASGLAEGKDGALWVGTDNAVVRWRPGPPVTYRPSRMEAFSGTSGAVGLAVTADGVVWAGFEMAGPTRGLLRLIDGTWRGFAASDLDGRPMPVSALLVDQEQSLWVGTVTQGLLRVRGDQVDRFSSADGLSGNYIYQVFEDRERNLWVVTTKGIDQLRDLRAVSYSTREGLSTEEVDAVLAARDGSIWIGGAGALDVLRDGRITSIRHGEGLPGDQVTSLLEDRRGRLWVGIDNTLTIYERGRFRRIDRPDGRSLGMVVGIAEDADGDIWAEISASPRRLVRIRDDRVHTELPAPAMPAARKVLADPGGGVWLGLLSGDLARLPRSGELEVVPFQRAAEPTMNSFVNQLHRHVDGAILGATSFGLIAWRHGVRRTLSVRNGLPCDLVHDLITDQEGDLWLYAQCGLLEIARADLHRWWAQPDVTIQPSTVIDVWEGAQPGLAPFQGAARSPDGRLWFANGISLQMIEPGRLRTNRLPPPVHIEEVVVDRRRAPARDGARLPPLTRDLEINYTALSLVVPQKVRFRYKLEGHDADWVEPGTRRQAFYSDLRPGDYRFRVIACNNDGVWNDVGAAWTFSVAPAWYQTGWFRAAMVVAGLLLMWTIHRLRVRQVAATLSARFDERLRERTRLARDLHDTLLQTIQASKIVVDGALDAAGDRDRLQEAAEQTSVWLAQAVQEGRAALNSLRTSATPPGDLVAALRQAIDDSTGGGFSRNGGGAAPATTIATPHGTLVVTLSVQGEPREIHPIVGEEMARIGREAIRNACRHACATTLEAEVIYGADLTLRVRDNGTGIDPAVMTRGKAGHFGLQGMRERARSIGGTLTVISGPGQTPGAHLDVSGTEITLVVPGGIVFSRPTQADG